MRTGRIWLTLLLLVCLPGRGTADRITFDDLYALPRALDPRISPDGKRIAFVLRERDPAAGRSEQHLWLMQADGSSPRQLTRGMADETRPRWSPDGSLLGFESAREGLKQVWILPMDGGEARPLVSLSTGGSGLEWGPAGKSFVLVSSVFPDCEEEACNGRRLAQRDAEPVKARYYESLLYRHYDSWADGRVRRLFVGTLGKQGLHSLVRSAHDVPTRLLAGQTDYDISPDGREVCFVMSVDTDPAVWVNNDLYLVPVGGGEPRRITTGPGLDTTPRYAPDGRFIAYRAQARAGYESDQADLMLYERGSGKHRNLTRGFDRSVREFVWHPQSRLIYFLAIDRGLSKLYRLEVPSGKVGVVLDDAVYDSLRVSPDGSFLVLSRSRSHEPHELYRYDLESGRLTRLTRFTEPSVSKLDLRPAEEFWFEGNGGDRVHGFLTRPPDFDPEKKYPLVLLIHGGPQWCWLGDFNYYGWNTQLVAAQGYVVAQIDPHGSVGYGLAFKEYVSGNWGRGDYEDLMKGIDHLLASHSFLDPERLAALGRSFGGFMVNWICGHTKRFDCLVSVDGSYEQVSDYGATEELWFPEWEFGGPPWVNPDEYARASPSSYAQHFETPTMVIHGEKDYRVDLSQGLSMFTALQRQGVPSALLVFPDEGHSVRKIHNLRFFYEKQFEWLARWLR